MGLLSVGPVSFPSEAELSRYLETLQRERAFVEDFALSPPQNGRAPEIVTVFRGSGVYRALSGSGAQRGGPTRQIDTACLIS